VRIRKGRSSWKHHRGGSVRRNSRWSCCRGRPMPSAGQASGRRRHKGNQPVIVDLHADDEADQLVSGSTTTATIGPGAAAFIKLKVKTRQAVSPGAPIASTSSPYGRPRDKRTAHLEWDAYQTSAAAGVVGARCCCGSCADRPRRRAVLDRAQARPQVHGHRRRQQGRGRPGQQGRRIASRREQG